MFLSLRRLMGQHFRPSRNESSRPKFRRPWIESLEDRCLPSTFTVINTNDSGPGSLRAAIIAADADPHAGIDTITFHIGKSVQTIGLQSALPAITHPVLIDGTTQRGFDGSPLIALDGTNAGLGAIGLDIQAGGSTVKGLVIESFHTVGIVLEQNGGDSIEGNYIGTDVTGAIAAGNGTGVEIDDPAGIGTTIGGTSAAERNLISGNAGNGVVMFNASGVRVEGNYIGTDATGTQALGNGAGVGIQGSSNTIGGDFAGAGNLISGNNGGGVVISGASSGNLLQGNLIGTDATGTKPLGNIDGVFLSSGPSNNTIGGTGKWSGNVIAANSSFGVALFLGAELNLVEGNKIGTDVTGTLALGNQTGVFIGSGSIVNMIGGTQAGAGNLISGNTFDGIFVDSSTFNLIEGNLIGTDVSGTHALGNRNGVLSTASSNTIGGSAKGAGNVISGNLTDGIALPDASSNNVIMGNKIGTDVTGKMALANSGAGISTNGSSNQIGGTNQGSGNLISGNLGDGIELLAGSGNVIQGNNIGTDISGRMALGNGGDGVDIVVGFNDSVGGSAPGAGNTIAFNVNDGVLVNSGNQNLISENSIFSNGGLGIELNAANQANNLQAAPILTLAVKGGGKLDVVGTLQSTPNTTFTIEFFASASPDPSGFGEGMTFLGSVQVTTDASGNAIIQATFGIPLGNFITATATDPLNDTSEFSNAINVVG